MNPLNVQTKNPWSDLILLLAIMLGTSLACQLPVSLMIRMVSGSMHSLNMENLSAKNPYLTYLLFVSGSIGTFLLPAYIFHRMNPRAQILPRQNLRNWRLYFLAILFLFAFGPLMSLISDWNMHLKFPAFLHRLERWIRIKEDEMALLMQGQLMTTSSVRLALNIVILAIVPAVAEEFFFRGALHNILKRIFPQEQIAVWVGAILFSAIHVQFYGFFPRLLLGVFFGYLLIWTKNIWLPILAHFINNASVVLLAFYYTSQGKSYTELMISDSYSIIMYLGSFIVSAGIAYWFYHSSTKRLTYGKRLG